MRTSSTRPLKYVFALIEPSSKYAPMVNNSEVASQPLNVPATALTACFIPSTYIDNDVSFFAPLWTPTTWCHSPSPKLAVVVKYPAASPKPIVVAELSLNNMQP